MVELTVAHLLTAPAKLVILALFGPLLERVGTGWGEPSFARAAVSVLGLVVLVVATRLFVVRLDVVQTVVTWVRRVLVLAIGVRWQLWSLQLLELRFDRT